MNEFDLIKNYFMSQVSHRKDVTVSIGDDAAVVQVPNGYELVITTDTLVNNIHFLETTDPYDIGYKSLAVNLSDLAAMGATPAWTSLSITLPHANENWIQSFCDGFFTLANRYQVQLIGGDLTHGPLSITVQALGFVPKGKAILRSQAKLDDLIYVTGTLGDAGLALTSEAKDPYQQVIQNKLNQPEPRLATAHQLIDIAHSAIDISDGLAADLGHILEQSRVGAIVYVDQLPLSNEVIHSISVEKAIALALSAGDDYELCFTIPPDKRKELEKRLANIPCRFTCIGSITQSLGLDLRYQNGNKFNGTITGYQHF